MNPQKSLSPISIHEAIALLQNGAVGVMPTDTIYGLVARAHDKTAVNRLYTLKHREHKPGTIIAANTDQLRDLGILDATLRMTVNLWPNPLSIILPVGDEFDYLHQGVGDIAIRVVADERLRDILLQTGPLLTSSANQPGEPASTTVSEAWDYFKDDVGFYVDGGDKSTHAPSTIIRLLDDGEIEVIRAGAVKL